MNQAVKKSVYEKGNNKQVAYMVDIGGMNEIEASIFKMFHQGIKDITIEQELGLSHGAFLMHEQSMREKLIVAVFQCINKCMDKESE